MNFKEELGKYIEIINNERLEITNIHREFREYETHRVTENEIRFEYLLC